jgi:hypothetical protein
MLTAGQAKCYYRLWKQRISYRCSFTLNFTTKKDHTHSIASTAYQKALAGAFQQRKPQTSLDYCKCNN